MYRELGAAGLANPVFHMNAFMMQTTIYNAEGSTAKRGEQKLAVREKTDYLNVEKMSIDTLKNRIIAKGYQQPTEEKLLRLYSVMETTRVFL